MNFLTSISHLVGSGAAAYFTARTMRDPKTRPNLLAGFQLAESGAVPFLEALSQRAASEGDEWLAESLSRHAADERRHGQIFASALQQHNKQVVDLKTLPKEESHSKSGDRKRDPFFGNYFDGYTQEDLKPANIDWNVFLASTHILELDASKDFVRMAHALPEDDPVCQAIKKGILSVARDETRHAAYLYDALGRRLHAIARDRLVDEWRARKANALVATMASILQRGGQTRSLVREGAPEVAAAVPA